MNEFTTVFYCEGDALLGIINQPENCAETAVLIVVGGPQYRVGSHRQFVQLARGLGEQGIASMRFDYRGMGDSEGDKKAFDNICEDIDVACHTLLEKTGCKNIAIWGLCDAASAAMIYAPKNPNLVGLVLLNPWLRNEQSMGKTMLKHYYLKRLFSKGFWAKMLGGKVNLFSSISDAKGFVKDSVSTQEQELDTYQDRMNKGIGLYKGKVCLILSGVDLTAKEFETQTLGKKEWKQFNNKLFEVHRIEGADHTFSKMEYKQQVESISSTFVNSL